MTNSVIDINLDDLPDNMVGYIKALVNSKDYSKKHNARIGLIQMGKSIIPQFQRLLASRNTILRKEAAEIVELIADKKSIPALIKLLDDELFDIQWIAAEGLIKIGRKSIIPLLKAVRDNKDNFLILKGAHHVLLSVLHDKEKITLEKLLISLDTANGLGETAPVQASIALKTTFKKGN